MTHDFRYIVKYSRGWENLHTNQAETPIMPIDDIRNSWNYQRFTTGLDPLERKFSPRSPDPEIVKAFARAYGEYRNADLQDTGPPNSTVYSPYSANLPTRPVLRSGEVASMLLAAAAQVEPDPTVIDDINQVDLAVFFSQYEDDENIDADVLERYLTNPELMQHQNNLIGTLIDRVERGEAPLNLEEFYQLALEETGDSGTALMVAHNVTKALSRGRSPIPWEKTSGNEPGEVLAYTFDGDVYEFEPGRFHPDAVTEANGKPSVFYAMFSQQAIGTQDPGDIYHFYLTAAVSYYSASGQLHFNDDPGISIFGQPRDYSKVLDMAVDDTMNQMTDAPQSNAYDGWRFANTLSYLEGAKYGQDYGGGQQSVDRESLIHLEGALFGLSVAGVEPDPAWRWYVPTVGSAASGFDTRVNLSEDTHTAFDIEGNMLQADGQAPTPPAAEEDNGGGARR